MRNHQSEKDALKGHHGVQSSADQVDPIAWSLADSRSDVGGYMASGHGYRLNEIVACSRPVSVEVDRDQSDVDAAFPERREIALG
jgi:hypothetical protein